MLKLKKVLALSVAILAMSSNFASAQELEIDSTAAIVNSNIILTSELNAAQEQIIRQFKRQNNSNLDPLTARKAALEGLISRELILQMAKRQGIDITDLQLDQALSQTAARNNMSVQNFLDTYMPGMPLAQAREKFKEEFIFNELKKSQIRNRINVSQTDVELLANNLKKAQANSVEPRYHLAQIIVPLSAQANIQQIQKADATINHIKQLLRQGANFNELAARYTQGSLAAQGGDLGYLPESQVPPPFLPALLKAKPADVLGPFRSPYGLHLIKLIDVSTELVEPVRLYDASHILLSTSIIFSDDAAVKKLKEIKSAIESGNMTFAQAASKYSEDTGSAINGGDLGYATPETYDPAFASAMVKLRQRQVSDPIKCSFGWHIIYLKDVKIDKNSMQAYEDKARALIYERQFKEEALNFEREIRDMAYIQVLDPQLLKANINFNQNN